MENLKVVVHLASTMGFGGVQSAIVKSIAEVNEKFDYHVLSLGEMNDQLLGQLSDRDRKRVHFVGSRFFYWGWFSSISKIAALKPDVLVVSLWKSVPPAFFYKLLHPKVPIIGFYHSSKAIHFADRFCQWLLARILKRSFADSNTTAFEVQKRLRIPEKPIVVPFHFSSDWSQVNFGYKQFSEEVRLVYFGRISKEKGIDRAIAFCSFMFRMGLRFSFHIYAPGISFSVEEKIQKAGLSEFIGIKAAIPPGNVSLVMRDYEFLVQLSDFEGMAMSVVEGMKNGLIPLVTQVGEMANYCKHRINGFVLPAPFDENLPGFAEDFVRCLANKDELNLIRSNALETFKEELTYSEAFCTEIRNLLKQKV